MSRIRIAFLLPHFRPGGAERVVLNWIGALDRARFAPVLMLGRVDGAFLDQLPADVPVIAIGGVTVDLVPALLAAGAHGVAVVAAVSEAADPAAAVRALLAALGGPA